MQNWCICLCCEASMSVYNQNHNGNYMWQSGKAMIEVEVNSIRVSLMNQQRMIVLKDVNAERYLPIWIGQFEAESITTELQENRKIKRPLTHDLLKSVIEEMGGHLVHIYINDMRRDIFYARLIVEVNGEQIEIDSRPSDAIAIAVRAKAPIFVSEAVMEKSATEPEDDVPLDDDDDLFDDDFVDDRPETNVDEDDIENVDESQFSAFADFVNSLDLDELDDSEEN